MKHAYFVALFLCLTLSLLSQSNPVSPTHQTVGVPSAIGASPIGASQADPQAQARILDGYGKLPLSFEANHGQADARVKFLSRTGGYTLFLTGDEAVLAWSGSAAKKPAPKGASGFGGDTASLKRYPDTKPNLTAAPSVTGGVLRMKLLNANPKTEVSGQDELPGKSNYFIGNDPKKWHTNVRQFAKVRYENVYPGVDLVYYGHQRDLEYDFVLQPGANPQAIRLGIEGAKRLRLEHGDLVLTSAVGDVHLRSPHIYQEANGVRNDVRGWYVIKGNNGVGFRVASYDHNERLVIDPVLSYATYLGGTEVSEGKAIAVDSAGNAYVTGSTLSTDFPMLNAIQPTNQSGGYGDAFVTKFNADGNALVYSTYLGGSNSGSSGNGIAVGVGGDAYVAGSTSSKDFPVVNPLQPTLRGGANAFVAKINAAGNALVYSTYLGGSISDACTGIAVDASGNAYVTGWTGSTDFPTANAIQSTNHGGGDAFVSKLNAAGTALVYSTYLGGSSDDSGEGIAVAGGRAYIVGTTSSTDFPAKNAIQPAYGGGENDAFVSKINAAGSALVYSTYLGGSGLDAWGRQGIAVDSAGNAYVTGYTESPDFPTANAFQPTLDGLGDAYVTKINASGNALVYSTYLGGSAGDGGTGIVVDAAGEAYVTGETGSSDFPTANAIQPNHGGDLDVFVTKFNASGNALVYSTYLGGSESEESFGAALDAAGSVYVTGVLGSNNFSTAVAFQPLRKSGGGDAFVAKIADRTFVNLSRSLLSFPVQVVGTTSAAKTITVTNQGSGSLTINKIYIGGLAPLDFGESNNCGATLAPSASCTISVTFTPTAKKTRKAGLGISNSDPASPDAITLNGTGTVVSLSPTKLFFGMHAVGTTSAPQTVTLTNVGSTPLNFTGISITGTNAGDFSQTNTCGTSIAAKASCTITVTFSPTATGTRLARLSIRDDGGGSPQRVALSGKGT